MKKILLLILFLISSNVFAIAANYVFIAKSTPPHNFEHYVNQETISKIGTKRRFWEYSNNLDDNDSIRVYKEIDCELKTSTILEVTKFSNLDLRGDILLSGKPSKIDYEYVAPNTIENEVMLFVCK